LRRPLESLAAGLALGLLPWLPRRAVRALAWLCGTLGHALGGRLRRVGEANLALAFPERTAEERRALLRACYRHYAGMILDVFWFSRHTAARLNRWVERDASLERIRVPEAQILLTAHFGNWEVAGMTVAGEGHRLLSVAAPLANPWVDGLFRRIRQGTGQTIIPQQGAILKLARGLRDGAKWALLLDQNTRPREGGVFVPFFGRPVPVSSAPAALALKLGIPVVVVLCLPVGGGRYRLFCPETLPVARAVPDEAAVHALTARMTEAVERGIRAQPAAWLWLYKRWKYRPEGDASPGWPWYARPLPPAESANSLAHPPSPS
jgi:KDO2-lipid IV(A) lauroyltransferase